MGSCLFGYEISSPEVTIERVAGNRWVKSNQITHGSNQEYVEYCYR
jgi:hypothetical protein